MHIIRTAEALARALDSPLDPDLKQLLHAIRERLAEYDEFAFEELAEIIVVEGGDTLDGVCSISGAPIATAGAADFTYQPELVVKHSRWLEITSILDDVGFGLILLVELATSTDTSLLALCERQLLQHGTTASHPLG
jgi:hypothetical protein